VEIFLIRVLFGCDLFGVVEVVVEVVMVVLG
jgi:hypothetical protein